MELGGMRGGREVPVQGGSWPLGWLLDPLGMQGALAKKPPGCTGQEGPSAGPHALPLPAQSTAGAKRWLGGEWVGEEEEKGGLSPSAAPCPVAPRH